MRKHRKSQVNSFNSPVPDPTLHIKLCHFCHHLNESEVEIVHCQTCEKPLTLFVEVADFMDDGAPDMKQEYAPWQQVYSEMKKEEDGEPLATDDPDVPRLSGLSVRW